MRRRVRFALGIALGGCLLLALSGSAGANRLSVSNQSMRWVFTAFSSNNAGIEIVCPLTLETTFHSRTFTKTSGSLIGYMTRATVATPCGGGWGDMAFLSETLPWHVRYVSFTGTLPNITSVRVNIIGFSWSYPGLGRGPCLYRSTEAGPAPFILNLSAGRVTSVTAAPAAVPLANAGLLCAETISYSGSGTVSLTGTTNPISISLI